MNILLNLRSFVRYLGLQIFIFIIKRNSVERVPGSLLLIRLDAIGDYILFRNFLKPLKESKQYKNYKITLCGNMAWKELAETFDKNEINDFIWIDRKLFLNSFNYKFKTLKQIHSRGFEIVIDTIHSRELLFGDAIVKVSNAREKIGSEGSMEKFSQWKRKQFSDKLYTKYITASSENLFEFYRNKEFFEFLLNTNLDIPKAFIDVSNISFNIDVNEEFAVIFPGASRPEKTWDVQNFIEVANFLKSKYSLRIVIAGSRNEESLSEKITYSLGKEILNLTGKTSLSQLAKMISSAKILVSNDTSAIHFAAAVDTPFVCISNGNRFGRFHPYPLKVFSKGHFIYPSEIMSDINNVDLLYKKYQFESTLNINSIKPEKVFDILQNLLK